MNLFCLCFGATTPWWHLFWLFCSQVEGKPAGDRNVHQGSIVKEQLGLLGKLRLLETCGQSERGEWFIDDLKNDSNQRDFLLSSFYSDIKGWISMFTWTISSWLLLFQQNDVSFTAHWIQIKIPPLLRPVCELWIQIPSYLWLMCETCCLSHFMLHNYFISLSNKDTFQLLNIQSALQS